MGGTGKTFSLKIHIPHSGSRQARDVLLDIRFAEVELRPPKIYSQTVKVWAVYAIERDAKDKAVEWMLITTVPVENFADAQKRVEWYSGRWGIEVFHRTLKSGCRVKDRQLETADCLETCLALDMVVAWRIYYLMMLGVEQWEVGSGEILATDIHGLRETPNVPCTVFFRDIEWKALCCYVSGKDNEWSDIDLAIVSNDFAGNRFEDRNKIRKITLKVNSDISPMPFRPEDFNDSDYFVREILETGNKIV